MKRRDFLLTAAGLVVSGPLVLAGCTDDSDGGGILPPFGTGTPDSTDVDTTKPRTTDDTQPRGTDETTQPPTTDDSTAAVVYRLSTRNQRAPCRACKAHAAHRYHASIEAADAGRAHQGCTCEVLPQRTTATQLATWFTGDGKTVFDDRWT